MKWSWHQLAESGRPVKINRTMDLSDELVTRDPDEILSADPMKVRATVRYAFGKVLITARITGRLTVPSSRSLVPVRLPINFRFKEIYVRSDYELRRYLKEHPNGDTVLTPDQNGEIDFNKSIIDNVILQIPTQVLSPKEKRDHLMPKGQGWNVISEDQYRHPKAAESKKVDPRLAKLKYYFSNNKKK